MRHRFPLLIACASALLALAPRMGAADTAAPAAQPSQADPRFQIPATDDGLPGAGSIHRSEWFQKLWSERRAAWASQVQDDQGALVFLGDSITQGWGDVGSSFPGIKTANRGIGGDTTRGVLIRLQDVIAVNPRGVVLLIGTNDIGDGVEPEVIAGNMMLIIAALRAHDPSMPVVLCEVFPSSTSKTRPADKIRKLNDLYMEAVADQPQVTVLDTWSLFKDVHGDAKEQEMPDLLHPDMVGYAKWAAALRPVLETVGLVPSWPDNFLPEPGFSSLFNGRDLTGWGYVGHPGFTGKTATDDDGRFVAKNGRLIVTVSHKGREIKKLWTARVFPRDFTLKLEFRASPNADSGIFVREPQLQCRDFIIAGPFAALEHYRPLDWNEIVVTVRGRLAHCTCNGEVIVDAMPVPPTGSIGLESDRGQVEYRRIRVEEAR
jgi:lysophospholipase L1-like esterase